MLPAARARHACWGGRRQVCDCQGDEHHHGPHQGYDRHVPILVRGAPALEGGRGVDARWPPPRREEERGPDVGGHDGRQGDRQA
jgi:hypothetical protein